MKIEMMYDGAAQTNPNVEKWESPAAYAVNCDEVPWHEMAPGVTCKILRFDTASNRVTMLMRVQPGFQFPVHKHFGDAEFFVLKGSFGYERGIVKAGSYGYEAPYAVHEPVIVGEEEMIMFVTSTGVVQFYNEDGSPGIVGGGIDEMVTAAWQAGALNHLKGFVDAPPGLPGTTRRPLRATP